MNFIWRLLSACVLLPLVLGAIVAGHSAMMVVIAIAMLIAFFEYGRMVLPETPHWAPLYAVLATVLGVASMMSELAIGLVLVFVAAFFILFISFMFMMVPSDRLWERLCALAMGVVYVGFPLSCAYWLRMGAFGIGENAGICILIFALFSTWMSDIFAYLFGKSIGRHKLMPRISPNKTWEGFIGGALGSLLSPLIAICLIQLLPIDLHPVVGWHLYLGLILPSVLLVPIGDLLESCLKRIYHVKDSGGILPGHGGILDRIDALLIMLPWAFAYALLLS